MPRPKPTSTRPRVMLSRVIPQEDGVGQVHHSVGAEVVFPQPHGPETQLLGQDGLLPQVVHQLVGAGGLPGGGRHGGERRDLMPATSYLSLALEADSGDSGQLGLHRRHGRHPGT